MYPTFITAPTFGIFRGDGRGAQSDGGTYRTSQFISVSSGDSRALISESFKPGVSETRGISVGREAVVGEREVLPTADGLQVSAEASDGLLFGLAPDLRYELTLTPAGGDGNLIVGGTGEGGEIWVGEGLLKENKTAFFVRTEEEFKLTTTAPQYLGSGAVCFGSARDHLLKGNMGRALGTSSGNVGNARCFERERGDGLLHGVAFVQRFDQRVVAKLKIDTVIIVPSAARSNRSFTTTTS